MITRRSLVGSGLAFATLPAIKQARAASFRIGLLGAGKVLTPDNNPWMQQFDQRLAQLGYRRGNNLSYDAREAGNDKQRLEELASELLSSRPDVIFLTSTPSLMALFKKTSNVPVVFIVGFDPVKLGIVDNLAHPNGNFTGIFNIATDTISKNFQIIRDLLPNAHRIAHLSTFALALSEKFDDQAKAAADQLGFEIKGFEIKEGERLPEVFDQISAFKADALTQAGGPFWTLHRREIIQLTHTHRLPSLHLFRIDVVDGALMSYGSDMDGLFRDAASYVDKIFQGAKPGDLPIEQATKLILAINMKTARELGLQIPPVLLASASELIE